MRCSRAFIARRQVRAKKWDPMPGGAKIGVTVLVSALLLLGMFIKNRESQSEVFEGVVDWGPMRTAFYPGGDCFASYYEYLGSRNASADLNLRREQTGKPHALWVKF